MPAEMIGQWRKMGSDETAAIDGVECSYQNVKTGEIIPPWVADPKNAGTYLRSYMQSVQKSGGMWDPYNMAKGKGMV